MKTGYNVLKNFAYMIFSNVVARFGSLITVVYLANILGPEGFGKLNFAAALIGYFAVTSDFGISTLSSRDIAQKKGEISGIVNSTLGYKIFFSLLSFLVILGLSLLSGRGRELKLLTFFYGLTVFTSVTFFLGWTFQGLEKMKYLSYSLILQAFVYVAAVFFFVRRKEDLWLIPLLLFIAQGSAVLFQFFSLKKLLPKFSFRPDLKNFKKGVINSFPITVSSFMGIVSQSTPAVILGISLGPAAVGFFASSQKISSLVWEVICNYMGVVFPAMSKAYGEDAARMNRIVNYSVKFSFVFLAPLLTLVAVLSYSITEFIYGGGFIQSYWTLKILIFLPLFMFLDSLFSSVLIVADRQRLSSKIKTISTLAMIGLLVVFVKPAGINGAALIMTLSFVFSSGTQYFYCSDKIKINFPDSILRPLLYSAVSGAIVFYAKVYSLPAAFILALSAYAFMIHAFKTFSAEELEFLKGNLKFLKSRFFPVKAVD